jgi:hypothetical protein
MRKNWFAGCGLAVGLMAAGSMSAFAQASAPVGFWTTQSGETLFVSGGGCSQGLNGRITVAGTCSWNATSATGGILTINSNGPVYFNVVWINQRTISVWGDIFTLQQ